MAVIVDIDGTLLYNGIYPIRKMVEWVNKQDIVYLVTARPEALRESTIRALRNANIKYNTLLMNSIGRSHVDGLESKRRHAKELKGKVSFAVDNDADARRVYNSIGIITKSPMEVTKFIWQF